jgi:hypothetical protein
VQTGGVAMRAIENVRFSDNGLDQVSEHISNHAESEEFLRLVSSRLHISPQTINSKSFQAAAALRRQLNAMTDRGQEPFSEPIMQNEQSSVDMPGDITPTRYTVSCDDWYQQIKDPVDEYVKAQQDLENMREARWDSVIDVASTVYGIAKVFVAFCRSFEVEVCRSHVQSTSRKITFLLTLDLARYLSDRNPLPDRESR